MVLLTLTGTESSTETLRLANVASDRQENDTVVTLVAEGHPTDSPLRKLVLSPEETLELIHKLSHSLVQMKVL